MTPTLSRLHHLRSRRIGDQLPAPQVIAVQVIGVVRATAAARVERHRAGGSTDQVAVFGGGALGDLLQQTRHVNRRLGDAGGHRHLLGAVAPRPVAQAARIRTRGDRGRQVVARVADRAAVAGGHVPVGVIAVAVAARTHHRAALRRVVAEAPHVTLPGHIADRIERHVEIGAPVLTAGCRTLATPARPAVIEPTVRDPDDDHVLACALGAQASLVATRDRDLLTLGAFRDIRILAARDAFDLIAAAAR